MRLGRLTNPLFALVMIGCAQTAPPTAPSGPVDPEAVESLARDFEQVAFHAHKTAINSEATTLLRIALPARFKVTVEDFMSPAQQRASKTLVTDTLSVLRSGTGLDVGVTDGDSVFVVSFTDQRYFGEWAAMVRQNGTDTVAAAFLSNMRSSGCAGLPITVDNVNVGGFVIVDAQRTRTVQTNCVTVGIASLVGITGSLTSGDTAAFDAVRAATGFSSRDLALIRMLYDPRLKPGMTGEQARPLLTTVAADALAR